MTELTAHQKWMRKKATGCDPDVYDQFMIDQKGVCAICFKPNRTGRALAADHNHKTGKVRGLLCTTCNTGLGHFKDDIRLVVRAAMYLEERNRELDES